MFKKLWNFFKDNAGAIIGGAIGGPVGLIFGAMIDAALQEIQKNSGLPFHLQNQVDSFAENHVKPIIIEYLSSLGSAATPIDLTKSFHVEKLNNALKKLAAFKAYHEYLMLQANDGNQVLVYEEIISALGASMQILIDTYQEATTGTQNSYNQLSISFVPSNFKIIGTFQLQWGTAQVTGSHPGFTKPGTINPTKPGGTIIQIPPPVITDPTTGSTKPTPGTTKPTPKPTTTPGTGPGMVNITTSPEKDNKKYWIIGGAVALAAYLFSQK